MKNFQFLEEFNTYSKYLKNFAYKLTKDKSAADDLFQETALSAFRHEKRFIPYTNFKAWLSTIMKNTFINHYRKNKRRNELQDNTKEDFFLNQSTQAIGNDGEMNINVQEILQLVDSLDEGYRVPFLMAYEGYRYDEIQEAMDLPIGTVKSKIHHARRILKQEIRSKYEDVAA